MDSSMLTLIATAVVFVLFFVLLWLTHNREKRFYQSATVLRGENAESWSSRRTVWIPENLLEERLEDFRNRKTSRSSVRSALLASEVYVLSHSGSLDPASCMKQSGANDTRLVYVFSSLVRLKCDIRVGDNEHSEVNTVKVRDWVVDFPDDFGLIVNPNFEYSFELLPDDIAQLKLELS